jgi:predicted metal-binding protein
MVVNFRACGICRGARKLVRTPTLKKKNNGAQMYNTKLSFELISRLNCSLADSMDCLRVWLRLLFKVLFTWKCIKIYFFNFLKIIFDISASK